MSSTYRILCLSHDPAIVTEVEWSGGTNNPAAGKRAAADVAAGVPGHETCDVLLGQWSGGLCAVACITVMDSAVYRCCHRDAQWVDALWLRLLLLAQEAPEDSPQRLLARRAPRCWSPERLHRLRNELSLNPALLEGPHMPEPIPTPEPLTTVYVSIGNSDNSLTQRGWSDFARDFRRVMHSHAKQVYGEWYSASDSQYQNACMAVVVPADSVGALRDQLTEMRSFYDQDSVAWAIVGETELI
jgi:hypothetical protein